MTIDVSVTTLAAPRLIKFIEKDLERIDSLKTESWEKIKDEITLDGFRQGSVPRPIAERKFPLQKLYPNLLDKLFDEAKKQLPKKVVKVLQYEAAFELNKPIQVSVLVDLEPEVVSCNYLDITIPDTEVSVSQEEIEGLLKSFQESSAVYTVVEKAAENNLFVKMNFSGTFEDGTEVPNTSAKDYKYQLGSKGLLPDFEAALLGMKAGETKTVEITFPENYGAEALRNKKVFFTITVNSVEEKSLPEIDDEFAKKNNFSSVEEMRKVLYDDRLQAKKKQQESIDNQQILLNLLEKTELTPIPDSLTEKQGKQLLEAQVKQSKLSKEDFLKRYQCADEAAFIAKNASTLNREIQLRFALLHVAQNEKLDATEAEKQEAFEAYAKRYNMTLEKFKEELVDETPILEEIKLRKAYSFVTNNATKVKKDEIPSTPTTGESKNS